MERELGRSEGNPTSVSFFAVFYCHHFLLTPSFPCSLLALSDIPFMLYEHLSRLSLILEKFFSWISCKFTPEAQVHLVCNAALKFHTSFKKHIRVAVPPLT